MRRPGAWRLGLSTKKYLRTKPPSRPCSGAPQLRQVISRSANKGSAVTRTTLYRALQFGQSKRVEVIFAIIGNSSSLRGKGRTEGSARRARLLVTTETVWFAELHCGKYSRAPRMHALPVCRLVWFADERLGRIRCARCCDTLSKRWTLVGTKGLARRSFLNSIPVIPG
jgi:hypothetical protein